MADNNEATVQQESVQQAASVDTTGQQGAPMADPFDDANWVQEPPTVEQQAAPAASAQAAPPAATTLPPATPPPAAEASKPEDVVDETEYLSKLGFNDFNTAQAEVARLRELEKQAPTRAGKEAVSKAIAEKEDEIFDYLNRKRQLSAIQNLDLSSADSAARILKMNLQFKHKELTPAQVDFQFNRLYKTPAKPVQGEDETEGDYNDRVANWQQGVDEVKQAMIIDATLAKPELLKYSSELQLPDIPIAPEAPTAPSAEEMQKAKETQEQYFKAVETGLSNLTGFDVVYKDNGVDVPIKYQASPEEKAKVKTIAEGLFTGWDYLINRWSNADGSFNGDQIAKDVLMLESGGKAFQKFVDESAAQVQDRRIKERSNIQLEGEGSQRIIAPGGSKSEAENLVEDVYSKEKYV